MNSAVSFAPTTTAEVAEIVREAAERQAALRVCGAGTWLDAGRPVVGASPVSLGALAGIVEYEPGDLTLTASTGTSLEEIARATAANGQWLTLDPFGGDRGTLGATVATASAGPLAHGFGTPRDLVLGIEFVTGKGTVVRGGGRVVKNVAGFDLTRLLTGAWGTLGIITEVTVRLRARPEADETLAVAIDDGAAALGALATWLRDASFVPFAFELVDGALAACLGLHDRPVLLARVGGNAAAVRAQRAALRELGDPHGVDAGVWTALRGAEPASAAVVRLSERSASFDRTWTAAREIARGWPGALVHGSPGRGIARVLLPHGGDEASLRHALDRPFEGTRIYERLPGTLWPLLAPSAVSDRLSRGIRHAYDPHHILNPGILGEVES